MRDTAKIVSALFSETHLSSPNSQSRFGELQQQLEEVDEIAKQIDDPEQRRDFQNAVGLLKRRLQLWQGLSRTSISPDRPYVSITDLDTTMLREIDTLEGARSAQQGWEDWRTFPLIDQLRELIYSGLAQDGKRRIDMAERLQHRMTLSSLTPEQYQYLDSPDFHRYLGGVRNWSLVNISQRSIMKDIEEYESEAAAEAGTRLAILQQELRYSNFPGDKKFGTLLASFIEAGMRSLWPASSSLID